MKSRVIVIICVIFAVGLIGSVVVLTSPAKNTVRITSKGEILYTIDLNTSEDKTITIPDGEHYNTVEIKEGKIRVKDADCPDKTCINMGWLSSSAMPIVCLPHHLVIEFVDADSGVDAVTR